MDFVNGDGDEGALTINEDAILQRLGTPRLRYFDSSLLSLTAARPSPGKRPDAWGDRA